MLLRFLKIEYFPRLTHPLEIDAYMLHPIFWCHYSFFFNCPCIHLTHTSQSALTPPQQTSNQQMHSYLGGLCCCTLLFSKTFSFTWLHGHTLSFQSLIKCHSIRKTFSDFYIKPQPHSPLDFLTLLCSCCEYATMCPWPIIAYLLPLLSVYLSMPVNYYTAHQVHCRIFKVGKIAVVQISKV